MIRQCQVSYTPGSALIHPLILSLASRARVFILSSFQQGGTNRPPTLAASTPGFPVFNPAAPTQGRSHLFQLQRRPASTPHPPRHREIEALRVVMSDCLLFLAVAHACLKWKGSLAWWKARAVRHWYDYSCLSNCRVNFHPTLGSSLSIPKIFNLTSPVTFLSNSNCSPFFPEPTKPPPCKS